eukprot:CAMPEP_0181440312 /NCGR_PEP_ID=MMETSP1110-20121109/22902_1 /TAXON_ID=174948 /ORGANISM="Symbiodinium sp., Strain CCMP421" /LENGTH=38 /DNA_ID= /DNA_START= /DNA_END= /DNA_ORIENTATION=
MGLAVSAALAPAAAFVAPGEPSLRVQVGASTAAVPERA